jgi:HPt (histidine-containing phosphotransfer) domain-containing protein
MNYPEEITQNVEQLYDMSYINKICRNDPERIKKMVGVFVSTIPGAVEEIKEQYIKQDYDALKKTAHRIKPVILIYAIVRAERVILDIEKMAKNRVGIDELGNKIASLQHTIRIVVNEMKKEFII